jgi:hypothetical protein
MKKALLVVAAAFLLYTLYQAINSTIFISHFPLIVKQLPNFIQSSQPDLQLALFLSQELMAGIGSYLRLIGAVFALSGAFLFFKQDARYRVKLWKWLLFESLYFLLLLPAGVNHIVGSAITSSIFLNMYTGVSFLLQAAIVFPALFMLSRKLKNSQESASIVKWAGVAAVLYVFGLWVRQGMMWVYALSPLGNPQAALIDTVGFVNSWLTLLVAAVVAIVAWLRFRQTKKLNRGLVGAAVVLVGVYFVVYGLVSVWLPIYRAFLPLTDFWMITLPILGIAILLEKKWDPSEVNH